MKGGIVYMSPEDAASYIRTAFGKEGWRKKIRRTMYASNLVSALLVGQQACGSDRLGNVIKWAQEMRRADDIHWC